MKGKIALLFLSALFLLTLSACGSNQELYKTTITVTTENESDLASVTKYFSGGFTQKKLDQSFKDNANAKIYELYFYVNKKEAINLIRGISSEAKLVIQDVEITNMFGGAFDYKNILKSLLNN